MFNGVHSSGMLQYSTSWCLVFLLPSPTPSVPGFSTGSLSLVLKFLVVPLSITQSIEKEISQRDHYCKIEQILPDLGNTLNDRLLEDVYLFHKLLRLVSYYHPIID